MSILTPFGHKTVIALVFLILCVFSVKGNKLDDDTSDHKCTKIKRSERLSPYYESGPCVLSYQARCGWFSLDLCTFYKRGVCDKNSNLTQYYYTVVKICCSGYIEVPNGTCISISLADPQLVADTINNTDVVYDNIEDIPKTTTKNPKPEKSQQIVHSPDEKSSVSKGAMAGAACGAVFLIVVIAFIILGVYKRRKNQPKKKSSAEKDDPDAGQMMLTTST